MNVINGLAALCQRAAPALKNKLEALLATRDEQQIEAFLDQYYSGAKHEDIYDEVPVRLGHGSSFTLQEVTGEDRGPDD